MIEWDTGEAMTTLAKIRAGLSGTAVNREAAQGMVKGTMETAPVLTGTLRRSIRTNSVGASSATYGPHVVYAHIQDQGGIIRVKRAKVLTNGTEFFGRQVTMPAQHYMARGAEAGEDYANQRLERFLRGVLG
jgi:phage gpG-like protein